MAQFRPAQVLPNQRRQRVEAWWNGRSSSGLIVRDRLGFVFGSHVPLMPDAPDRAELEAAINRYLSLHPAHERIEKVIVKVGELEPVTWPPDSKQLRAGLFLSVGFLGGDRTKLDQALARIRRGFKRNEILRGWHVELSEEKVYSHRDDDAGAALLTLPVLLTLTPA